MSVYDSRVKAAFNSLGMRPVEILEDKEESVGLGEVVEALREDEDVETVLEPFVKRYFKVLDEKGMVEYDDSIGLYDSRDKSVRKNGCSDEEIQRFVESFGNDY